jgi:hypothetical protein
MLSMVFGFTTGLGVRIISIMVYVTPFSQTNDGPLPVALEGAPIGVFYSWMINDAKCEVP